MKNVSFLLLAILSVALGQGKRVEESQLSFLALGNPPPFAYEPNPKPSKPAPWVIFPSKLRIQHAQGESENIELMLGKISDAIRTSGGNRELLLFGAPWGFKMSEKEWAAFQIPETGNYLGLLVQSQLPKEPSWEKVNSFVLKNDGRAFPAGTMRIFNASSVDIVMKTGEEKAALVRPKASLVKEKILAEELLKLFRKDEDGRFRAIFSNHSPKLKEGERLSVFIYDEKGSRRGGRVRFVVDSVPEKN